MDENTALWNVILVVITEEMITEVETSLDDFKAMIGLPRTIRNQAFAYPLYQPRLAS